MNQVMLEDFPDFIRRLQKSELQLIDVRAEVEFSEGSIPGSLNSPILNNEERALVGTTYKKSGPSAAVELGHKLVSGAVKEARLKSWQEIIQRNPNTYITCFRGGLRSKITQAWLEEAGQKLPRIQGGYKALRQYLIQKLEQFPRENKFLVITGATGSGKTKFLRQAKSKNPFLDLELAANHRGSAFGSYFTPQPRQALFENNLALQIFQLEEEFGPHVQVLLEDESRLIGRCVQPPVLFESLRESPVLYLDVPLEQRVLNTFDEYVLQTPLGARPEAQSIADCEKTFVKFETALHSIHKRLGGLKFSEISKDLLEAKKSFFSKVDLEPNKIWIRKLLESYYDPMYFYSLDKRQAKVVFRGAPSEAAEFLARPLAR